MFIIEPNNTIPESNLLSIVETHASIIMSIIREADVDYTYSVGVAGHHEPEVDVEYHEFSEPEAVEKSIAEVLQSLIIREAARLHEVKLIDERTTADFIRDAINACDECDKEEGSNPAVERLEFLL